MTATRLACGADKNPGDEEAERKFQQVAHAYNVRPPHHAVGGYTCWQIPHPAAATPRRHRSSLTKTSASCTTLGVKMLLPKQTSRRTRQPAPSVCDPVQRTPATLLHDAWRWVLLADMFFGGGGQRRNQKKGQDIQAEVGVTLEDRYNGGEVSARISRNVVCRGCAKKPGSKKCRGCGQCPPEIRMVTRQMAPGFNVQMQEEVPSKEKCKNEATTLTATVEKGMPHGEQIKFERMSEQRPGMIPGDVIFVLKQRDHALFRRDGNDLHVDMHISLKEALVGFTKTVKQLDGREVVVESTGVTRPHQVRTIRGEGMPIHNFPSQAGDMHVKFYVDFPAQLSPDQVDKVKELF